MPNLGVSEFARGAKISPQYMTVESLLQESNKNLRLINKALCCGTNTATVTYQPVDCDGDPVGGLIQALPVLSVAKQDVSICNYQQVADAINGGDVAAYNIPVIEAASSAWSLSDNNDTTTVHSISISVIGTPGGTLTLSIDGGTAVTLPVGYTYSGTATSTFGVDYDLASFAGGATAVITILKSA